MTTTHAAVRPAADTEAPRATRSRTPGWRNPRLLIGLALVAGSVLVGARLMAAADDTVAVWTVTADQPAGARLTADDVEARRVRFAHDLTAAGYLPASEALPEGTLDRAVSAGELLPRSALTRGGEQDVVEVPVSLAADDLPATVRRGSLVDVWVAPDAAGGGAGSQGGAGEGSGAAVRVLQDVVVVAVPRASSSLAPQATRQVIVGLPPGRDGELGRALGQMSEGRVVVARVG
jgi:hypothetical protein